MESPTPYFATLSVAVLLVAGPPALGGTPNPLDDPFDQALVQARSTALPEAIQSFLVLAQDAATLDVSLEEIRAGEKRKRLYEEMESAGDARKEEIQREIEALEEICARLNAIKDMAAAPAPAPGGEETGSDPALLRLSAGQAVTGSGHYTFTLDSDGFLNLPGDNPVGPMSALVVPRAYGFATFYVPVLAASIGVDVAATGTPGRFALAMTDFAFELDSFEVAPGLVTGVNHGTLNPNGSPAVGELDLTTGLITGRLEGLATNDINDISRPMLFFAHVLGSLDSQNGILMLSALDPVLVPLSGMFIPANCPRLIGAHVLDYDAASGALSLLENTTLLPDADVAMIRYGDKTYAYSPAVDLVIGARLEVDPLLYTGQTPESIYTFANASIRVTKDATALLEGTLTDPNLNPATGVLLAGLEVTSTAGSSPAITQIGSAVPGTTWFQIALGAAAFDLVSATAGFTASARLDEAELFHLGVFSPSATGVTEARSKVLRLYPTQPNPFNPRTTIRFDLPEAGVVHLSVFDVAGRLVRTLLDERAREGSRTAVWDGRDSSGREVGSGTYLVRLEAGGVVESVRMSLIR